MYCILRTNMVCAVRYNIAVWSIYGKAQLQGNFRTRLRRVLHVFQMHPACIPAAPRMHFGCVLHLAEKGVAAAKVLLQLYHEVLCLHGHVSCAFRTRLAHISDTCECYLEAELNHI